MQLRAFGYSVQVPVLGIGTWKMEYDDRAAAIAAIRRAVELGMTHVDTAELYGSGRVETLVGEALDGLRDRVFLVSKVLPQNASYAGTLRACEQSLKRLRTDDLDCYLLHWREDEPLAETFRAFEKLREQGKIRAWGVSNFDHADLAEAQLGFAGEGRIACNQVAYHLDNRTIEHHVIPWCEQHARRRRRVFTVRQRRVSQHAEARRDRQARRRDAAPARARVPDAPAVRARDSEVVECRPTSRSSRTQLRSMRATIAEIDALFPLKPWRGLHTL